MTIKRIMIAAMAVHGNGSGDGTHNEHGTDFKYAQLISTRCCSSFFLTETIGKLNEVKDSPINWNLYDLFLKKIKLNTKIKGDFNLLRIVTYSRLVLRFWVLNEDGIPKIRDFDFGSLFSIRCTDACLDCWQSIASLKVRLVVIREHERKRAVLTKRESTTPMSRPDPL